MHLWQKQTKSHFLTKITHELKSADGFLKGEMRGEEKWGPRKKKITRVLKKQGMLEAKGSFLKIEPEKAQGCVSWTGVLGVEPGRKPLVQGNLVGRVQGTISYIIQGS